MKRFCLVLLALAAALAITPAAFADTFSFLFTTSNGTTFSGSLTGDLSSLGVYAITSGSGTLADTNWASGNGAYPVVPDPSSPNPTNSTVPVTWFTYDDLLTPGASDGEILDNNGLYFYDSSLQLAINIWSNGAGQPYTWELADSGGYRDGGDGEFYITPEPDSLLLLGTGLFGLALAIYWKASTSKPNVPMMHVA